MQVERPYHLSPVEQEYHFLKWAQTNGIERILFDLDDTICNTGPIFNQHKQQALDYFFASHPQLNPEQLTNMLTQTDIETFEELGVNANRFDYITDLLCDNFNLSEQTRSAAKIIFQGIYTTPITFLTGAEETLKFLKKIEIPIGIVTHANRHWTYQKYQWMNLERYLDWDDIYTIDENGHKTSESWLSALRYFHLQPQNCAIIGDSPRSDINPARSINVQHCFLVKNQSPWLTQQQPIDPKVRIIKDISDLIKIGSGQL